MFGCVAVLGIAVGFSTIGIGPGFLGGDDSERSDAADGYPLRITRPYVLQDLPTRPGAIAGLLRSDESWLAVSPHGHLWELADDDDKFEVLPALSDDGRVLAYLQTSDDGFGEYVIRDLVSGVLTAFPDAAPAGPIRMRPSGRPRSSRRSVAGRRAGAGAWRSRHRSPARMPWCSTWTGT